MHGYFVGLFYEFLCCRSFNPPSKAPAFFSENLILTQSTKVSYVPMDEPSDLGWLMARNVQQVFRHPNPYPLRNWERYVVTSTGPYGDRLTPNPWGLDLSLKAEPLLALGDSFTFGGEVNDEETWPTHLQAILRRPVINAGQSLYGLDQSITFLENILEQKHFSQVILSVTANSIRRTVQPVLISRPWKKLKHRPYFRIVKGQLVEGQPVDLKKLENENIQSQLINKIRLLAGYSFLADLIFKNTHFRAWYGVSDTKDYLKYSSGEDPLLISCAFLNKLKTLSETQHFSVLLIFQDPFNDPKEFTEYPKEPLFQALASCATALNLPQLKLSEDLKPIWESRPDLYQTLFFWKGHMTNHGNLWVAQKLAQVLKYKE